MKEFIEPTIAQKRELRKEMEHVDLNKIVAGRGIVPTDFAEKALLFCFGIDENEFYNLGEAAISGYVSEVVTKVFFRSEEQKKS